MDGNSRASGGPRDLIRKRHSRHFRGCGERGRPQCPNVWGGVKHKKYIIEAKGSGLAFFDYDQDGWLDIYLTNGDRCRVEEPYPDGKTPTQHLLRTTATARSRT
jgi:hypothetical protein